MTHRNGGHSTTTVSAAAAVHRDNLFYRPAGWKR